MAESLSTNSKLRPSEDNWSHPYAIIVSGCGNFLESTLPVDLASLGIKALNSPNSTFHYQTVGADELLPWGRVALVSGGISLSVPTFVAGMEIATVLGYLESFLAFTVGCIILTIIACLTGLIGARTRLSSYFLARIAFGPIGAMLINIAFAVSLLGWFGVNIDLFSAAALSLAQNLTDYRGPSEPIEIAAGLLMMAATALGFKAIDRLSLLFVPIMLLATLTMFYFALVGSGNEASLERIPTSDEINFGAAVSSVVGSVIIGAIIIPDITRFIREPVGAVYSATFSFLILNVLVMAIAGFAALVVGETEILNLLLALGFGWGAFVVIIGGSWIINSLNLYSCALSLAATSDTLKGPAVTVGLGILGIAAAFFNILDQFLNFLFYLSIAFVPVGGIILTDYFVVRRQNYETVEEWRDAENYSRAPVLSWFFGFLFAMLAGQGYLVLTTIPVLDSVMVASVSYLIFAKLLGVREKIVRSGS